MLNANIQNFKHQKKIFQKKAGGVIIFHENIHPCIKKIIIQIIFDVELFCEILSKL